MTLDGLLAEVGAAEEADLPAGFSELSAREARFVCNLLKHGQLAQAAAEAGYKDGEGSRDGLYVTASRLLRRPKIHRFYRSCIRKIAESGDKTVERVAERSVLLHAKAVESGQKAADLQQLILLSRKTEDGTHGDNGVSKDVREYETALAKAMKEERHYMGLANQTDTLLASLLGKLQLSISGEVDHNHYTIPAGALEGFAHMRRDSLADAGREGAN